MERTSHRRWRLVGLLNRPFHQHPPEVKVAAWLGLSALAAIAVQLAAWGVGLSFDVMAASGGRGVLLVIALGALAVLMSADRRSLSDYGLAVPEGWLRPVGLGLAIGAATLGTYVLAAFFAGALAPDEPLTARSAAVGAAKSLTALPLAAAQQIIFAGYLLGLFRERRGRVFSVAAVAALFAILQWVEDPLEALTAHGLPLFFGKLLVAALLAELRLVSGNILFGAGLLAGWLLTQRFIGTTDLLNDGAAAMWLAPDGDPRRSPVVWLALLGAILAAEARLRRRGEASTEKNESDREISRSFRRVYPFATMGALAPIDVWLAQLWRARFAVGLIYIPRLVATLIFSLINTIVSLPERLVLPVILRRRRVRDPVFIVGAHRSGTTHLQNLLALDPQCTTARTRHVINPVGFVFSGWLLAPLLAAFSPWRRPMDAVRFGFNTPNEDEYAMANSCGLSPDWSVRLPRLAAHYDRYIYPERFTARELCAWKRRYLDFLRRLTMWSNRRPLLKNPYNTARVGLLREMFPGARFIHIRRDPERVYLSNRRMSADAHCLFQLQDPPPGETYMDRFLDHYRRMESAFYRDVEATPAGRWAEVRFEDLERDPIGRIRAMYERLGLAFTETFERRLRERLDGLKGYRKNAYTALSGDERRRVREALAPVIERWEREDGGRPGSATGLETTLRDDEVRAATGRA